MHRGEDDRYRNLEYHLIGERCEKGWYRVGPFMPRNLPVISIPEQNGNIALTQTRFLSMFPNVILGDVICHVMLRSSGGRPFPLKVPALRV